MRQRGIIHRLVICSSCSRRFKDSNRTEEFIRNTLPDEPRSGVPPPKSTSFLRARRHRPAHGGSRGLRGAGSRCRSGHTFSVLPQHHRCDRPARSPGASGMSGRSVSLVPGLRYPCRSCFAPANEPRGRVLIFSTHIARDAVLFLGAPKGLNARLTRTRRDLRTGYEHIALRH